MDLIRAGVHVLLGALLGTVGGLFGIGGGLIAIPALGILFGLDQQLAHALPDRLRRQLFRGFLLVCALGLAVIA